MSFYRSTDNTHWGTVGGPFVGVGGVTVGGSLELVWQGSKV